MSRALQDYGRADLIQASLGLTPEVGHRIAAIISFSGAIEHHLERAIWRLRGMHPKGIKPDTDARPVADLIAMLEKVGADLPGEADRAFVATWSVAARSGFTIRHNIAHGVPLRLGDTLAYMRNPRWEGELRRREFGDFFAEIHTLDLVRHAFAVLYRTMGSLARDGRTVSEVATKEAWSALREARSVLGEFASQGYDPSVEKY